MAIVTSVTNETQRGSDEELAERGTRQRRVQHPDTETYVKGNKQREQELARISRWAYLLSFGSRHISTTIKEESGSYGPVEHSASRVTILEWQKVWKSRSLKFMVEHVQKVKEADKEEHPDFGMHCTSDSQKLFLFFLKSCTEEKFLRMFYFAKPILDYERSAAKGKWYLKQIYANLAVEVKLWDDMREERTSSSDKANALWQDILDLWDYMAQAPEYQDIKKKDFAKKRDMAKKRTKKGQEQIPIKEKALKKLKFSAKPGDDA